MTRRRFPDVSGRVRLLLLLMWVDASCGSSPPGQCLVVSGVVAVAAAGDGRVLGRGVVPGVAAVVSAAGSLHLQIDRNLF